MTDLFIIITATVVGWLIYEYFTPWGTATIYRERDRDERRD